jgi:hypothetical protein
MARVDMQIAPAHVTFFNLCSAIQS